MRKISKRGLHKRIWDKQSTKIRSEAATFQGYVKCYTCDILIPWKEAQMGHFKHNKLDFDHRNLKIQCVRCNHFLHGNLGVYGIRLARDYGFDWVEQLERDAAQHKGYGIKELKLIEQTL